MVIDTTVASVRHFTPAAGVLANGTTYYWEVNGSNATSGGNWSSISSFIPGLAPPFTISAFQYPAGPRPFFKWEAVPGATSYRILIGTDYDSMNIDPTAPATGSGIVIDTTTTDTTFTPISPLTDNTQFYWEVAAFGPARTTITPARAWVRPSPTN